MNENQDKAVGMQEKLSSKCDHKTYFRAFSFSPPTKRRKVDEKYSGMPF